MSQIAVVLGVVSPLVLALPLLAAMAKWLRASLRFVSAMLAACAAYGLVLTLTVVSYPAAASLAAIVYGAGIAAAAFSATCIGALAGRHSQQRILVPVIGVLATLIPIIVYAQTVAAGTWSGANLIYVVGSLAGNLFAARLLSWTPSGIGYRA